MCAAVGTLAAVGYGALMRRVPAAVPTAVEAPAAAKPEVSAA